MYIYTYVQQVADIFTNIFFYHIPLYFVNRLATCGCNRLDYSITQSHNGMGKLSYRLLEKAQ